MLSGGSLKWPHPKSQKGFTWELKPKERCHSSTASVHGSMVTQVTAQKHSDDKADWRCSVHRMGSAVPMWEATAICRGRSVRSLGVLVPWEGSSVGRFALAELPDSRAELSNGCFEHISSQLKKSPWMKGSFLCLCGYPAYGCFCVEKDCTQRGSGSTEKWLLKATSQMAPQLTAQHCLLQPSLMVYFNSTDLAHCNYFPLEEKFFLSLKSIVGKHRNNCSIPWFPPNLFIQREACTLIG